jgi:hypothetical protein
MESKLTGTKRLAFKRDLKIKNEDVGSESADQ